MSSVNSTLTAHSCRRQYSTCAAIWGSVRSGRKEKVPWVTRMSILLAARSLISDRNGGWSEGGGGGWGVVGGDVAPSGESGAQRLAPPWPLAKEFPPPAPQLARLLS